MFSLQYTPFQVYIPLKLIGGVMLGLTSDEIIFLAAYFIFFFLLDIFYVLTIRSMFLKITPENRALKPNYTFFLLIPFFGIFWDFVLVVTASKSLRKEFDSREIARDGDFGFMLGIVMCVLFVIMEFSTGSIFTVIPACIVWIFYWARILRYRKMLKKLSMRVF